MPQAKKFGAFAGVFTPSLLTILGVIMYMRLGWVVGQSGLITALVIILISHIISITTGLSISSVATDKKIRAGGIYYILSRSLGLPMGGAIGIALFIGTALSISLYLVGFAESFLGIESIRNFLGLDQNVDGYRIVGTASIVLLVILAFISTSLAIKTQFYILGFILLSLVSIAIGLFTGGHSDPSGVILSPAPRSITPEAVFAVFFPAVTGFTAGVAMSGDLSNPKKAIPIGTLASIAAGLVVYVGLAIGFAFFIDRELMLTDNNFLLKIAWFSPLVIAGIWGATLSSALGGILGGPRILQAISSDRITPRLFAKTYGTNNEPRNALIFIFLIAEAGILIGELNVIAGIVSMFYLASYGFINLAFFLESWASTDFRPSFKVSRYVGFIGFIAAFGVMFKLDMVSMIAALIIMWGLFFYLKRKNLKSSYGDVWQSVYSSVVKTALHRMDRQEEAERNWKPNIILYSGGTKKRPHLIEFGKCIVGKHGVLSNFDLIENKDSKVMFPKRQQSVMEGKEDFGIFTRKKTVKDIYEGIETISAVYGFSGFEPNTVLLGWGRQTRNPERFVQSLNTLYNLDLNVLILDYDKRVGFGKYKLIDIWWKDVSNQGNLALSVAKLILLSRLWDNANVRLMIANSRNDQNENIYRRAEKLLENMRFNARIKVINNEIEKKSLYDLMYAESRTSDLVIVGMPEIVPGNEADFVASTNKLLHKIGTVLLIKASSTFKKLKLGSEATSMEQKRRRKDTSPSPVFMDASEFPEQESLRQEMKEQLSVFSKIIDEFHSSYVKSTKDYFDRINTILQKTVDEIFNTLESPRFRDSSREQQSRIIAGLKTNYLVRASKIPEEMQKDIIREQTESLRAGIEYLINRIDNTAELIPAVKPIVIYSKDLEKNITDHPRSRLFKSWKKFKHTQRKQKAGIEYSFKLRKLFRSELPLAVYNSLVKSLDKYGRERVQANINFQQLVSTLNQSFEMLELRKDSQISEKRIGDEKVKTIELLKNYRQVTGSLSENMLSGVMEGLTAAFTEMNSIADKIPANFFMKDYPARKIRQVTNRLNEAPVSLAEKLILLHNATFVDIRLTLIKFRIRRTVKESMQEISKLLHDGMLGKAAGLQKQLEHFIAGLEEKEQNGDRQPKVEITLPEKNELQLAIDKITDKAFRNIKTVISRLPKSSEFLSPESFNRLTNTLFEETESVKISTFQLVDYYVQYNLLEPMINSTGKLAEQVLESIDKIRDATRRVSFGNQKPDVLMEDSELLFDDQSFKEFAREQVIFIGNEIQSLQYVIDQLSEDLDHTVQSTLDELSIYSLLKTPEKYRRYLRRPDRSKTMIKRIRSVNQFFRDKTAQFWHRQSDAILFARKVAEPEKAASTVNEILNIREKVSPSQAVLDKLPFYYQQLFLRKYNYQSEFWFNRNKEIAEVDKAINRHALGHSGGVLVRGEQNSGKTFFVNYIAATRFNSRNVYYIQAQSGGSVNVDTFVKALQEVTGINEPYLNIFARLPEDALVIIDNLELWWEKSKKGLQVISLLAEVMQKFSSRQFFLFTANTESFKVINRMHPIDRYFLNIVDMKPLNSKHLQEAILFRHRTSGFDLKLSNKRKGIFHTADMAHLFSKYFNYSRGNIGIALITWVAGIEMVNDKTIEVKPPQVPDISVLRNLTPEIKLYLTQFILHKRLDFEKLQRVTLDPEEIVERNVRFMKRSGLISETAGHIYELDKYMYVHINQVLFERSQTTD